MNEVCELWVRDEFEAAHSLEEIFPPEHQCSRMHGHRYEITLAVRSVLGGDIVIDYYELAKGLREILDLFEHQNLNEIMTRPSTCENLAKEILDEAVERWPLTYRVEVKEQTNTGCVIFRSTA